VKAAVWVELGKANIEIREVEPLPLRDHEVVVRVEASNVSVSDYFPLTNNPETVGQPVPQILGHCGAGVVIEIGPKVERLAVGDKVVVTSTPECGECHFCVTGSPEFCAEMAWMGPNTYKGADGVEMAGNAYVGAFAEHMIVPDIQATKVETDLPFDQLAMVALPIATGVGAALRVAPVTVGSDVVVLGAGSVGISYIQGAKLAGASTIVAVDPLAHRRELALKFGATHVVDPGEGDVAAQVRAITGDKGGMLQGAGGDFVFEAAADARAIEQAWDLTRSGGHTVLCSVTDQMMDATVTFPALPFAVQGKTVHTVQGGGISQRRDIPWLVTLIESGQLNVADMIDAHYPLADISKAMDDMMARSVLAPILMPQS
jgi:S-(hydroxymethyl)glutathione dehydrogenase/alcohol dehydrogenase